MKYWTTEDISRELHLSSRAVARKWVKRHRDNGVKFEVVIDEITSERHYVDRLPLNHEEIKS